MGHTWRPDAAKSADLIRQSEEWSAPQRPPDKTPERWTTSRIRQAALLAASRCRYPASSLCDDPVRLAESGIGLAVAIDPQTAFRDAVFAGQNEIFAAARGVRHTHGQSAASGWDNAPRFYTFWTDRTEPFPAPTRVEVWMTLARVIADLPAQYVEVLTLLAFTESTAEAAEAYGYRSREAFLGLVRKARRAALELWFDHETPPDLRHLPIYRRSRDRICPQGHLVAGDNVRRDRSASGRVHERCKACRSAADKRAKQKEA